MSDWSFPTFGELPLDPSPEEWQRLSGLVQAYLADALSLLSEGPTLTPVAAGTTLSDSDDLPAFLDSLFQPGFNPAHPGFMAYIPGGGLVTSALADWLIKTMNRYGTAHFASPKLAELEYQVVRLFADWVGYDDQAAGVLTTGGSLANFTAVVTARRAMLPEDFLSGVLFCSDQTHHSVLKAANLAGFSTKNVCVVASDENFRLDLQALQTAIVECRDAGNTPFMVVGSAGTTNTGSVDPLDQIGEICAQEGLWFHVDAAYGGAFVITRRGSDCFYGLSRADSITLDPHKGFFLPYGTGGILVKDRDRLIQAHELRGDYMPELDRARAHLDPFSLSVELSREHRGLKVALPLMLHGEQAFIDALDEKLDLTQVLYDELSAMPEIEVLHKPDLTTIAFRFRMEADLDSGNRRLLEEINAGSKVYLSGTVLDGSFALRISILSHRTHAAEVRMVLSELRRAISTIEHDG